MWILCSESSLALVILVGRQRPAGLVCGGSQQFRPVTRLVAPPGCGDRLAGGTHDAKVRLSHARATVLTLLRSWGGLSSEGDTRVTRVDHAPLSAASDGLPRAVRAGP